MWLTSNSEPHDRSGMANLAVRVCFPTACLPTPQFSTKWLSSSRSKAPWAFLRPRVRFPSHWSIIKSSTRKTDLITATRQEMSEARLPMQYRDSCAHLLIPLNRCRQAEYYLPWKCEVRNPSFWLEDSAHPDLMGLRSGSENLLSKASQLMQFFWIHRTSDTRMRNASMKSSRSVWPRWMSCVPLRMAPGATEFWDCWYARSVLLKKLLNM